MTVLVDGKGTSEIDLFCSVNAKRRHDGSKKKRSMAVASHSRI
jgi:hypothetical protein